MRCAAGRASSPSSARAPTRRNAPALRQTVIEQTLCENLTNRYGCAIINEHLRKTLPIFAFSAAHHGVWLSLVERLVRDQEVASSNLVTPTIKRGGMSPLFLWSERWYLHLRPRVHEPLRDQGFQARDTPVACPGRRKSLKTWAPQDRACEGCTEPLFFARATRRKGQKEGLAPSLFFWSER